MRLPRSAVAVCAFFLPGLVCALAATSPPAAPIKPSPENLEFFEKRVRPLLAQHCVPCHSGAQPSGNLHLEIFGDLWGADGRPAIVTPGSPDKSTLIQAVRYTVPALRMPPDGKLSQEQIATLEEWVRRGAPVPQVTGTMVPAPSPPAFSLAKRRQHWAYQPVRAVAPPPVKNKGWVRNPIDQFILARLEAAHLAPAPPADKRTLLRRVTFDLTGLPPTPAAMSAFLQDTRPDAYERQVERLLASPAYGERWARHWLDLVRYGETLGHEYDFDIPNAFQYRDYVIRALNADVPYDQFVREHLAGDLMAQPRRDPAGRNESLLGTGFWWLAEGKHSPVDVKQEQADRIDNQIDVFGKAFLGQTIACARCHDHKFDPIPTRDYYGLYGMLKSSRYQQAAVDAPATFARPMRQIDAVRNALPRATLAKIWQTNLESLPDTLLEAAARTVPAGTVVARSALVPFARWRPSGAAFSTLGQPGDLVVSGSAEPPIVTLLSDTVAHSALRSRRLEGALRSPTFTIDQDYLHLRLAGQQGRVHIIVENFELIRDPIYGPLSFSVDNIHPGWHTIDMRLWKGRRAYVELSDSPLPNLTLDPLAPTDQPFTGWLRLDAALLSDTNHPPPLTNSLHDCSVAEVRARLSATLTRWADHETIPADADALALLDDLLAQKMLDTSALSETARQLSAIETAIPAPTRAVAMCEGDGEDETVFVRGNYRTPGAPAPRMQLAVCFRENIPSKAVDSGRRELAAWITRPTHPLTARVMVNRLWKHHFGTGLVPTTDDFGHMGEKPTHPALLDWLASEFVRQHWSLKAMHRRMVLSSTYCMASSETNPALAARKDPENALLHRMPVQRLEAEAIRDAILSVSGRLDPQMYGPPLAPYLKATYVNTFEDGRGRPASGPLDGAGRRSVYLGIRRNFLSPWMVAFDFPIPFTAIGRRTVSNVPSQALAMMNGPFVRQQAEVWATRILMEMPQASPNARIVAMYQSAFGRSPTPDEATDALAFVTDATAGDEHARWSDLCHVLFNVKEFIFVR